MASNIARANASRGVKNPPRATRALLSPGEPKNGQDLVVVRITNTAGKSSSRRNYVRDGSLALRGEALQYTEE
jgi:hypothetical protein